MFKVLQKYFNLCIFWILEEILFFEVKRKELQTLYLCIYVFWAIKQHGLRMQKYKNKTKKWQEAYLALKRFTYISMIQRKKLCFLM